MWVVEGLPAHVLLVHAQVVLVPAVALAVVAAAWLPSVRRRLGLALPGLALAALVLTPLTTESGEWFQAQLPPTPLIVAHAELGDAMLRWVTGLFVAALGVHLLGRRADRLGSPTTRTALRVLAAVIASVLAAGAVVATVRAGESGARAVWEGTIRPAV